MVISDKKVSVGVQGGVCIPGGFFVRSYPKQPGHGNFYEQSDESTGTVCIGRLG